MNKRLALARLVAIGWSFVILALYFWNAWFLVPYFVLGFLYLCLIEDRRTSFLGCSTVVMFWSVFVIVTVVFWKEEFRYQPVKEILRIG